MSWYWRSPDASGARRLPPNCRRTSPVVPFGSFDRTRTNPRGMYSFGVSDRSASENPTLSSLESDDDSDDRSDRSDWLSIDVLLECDSMTAMIWSPTPSLGESDVLRLFRNVR